MTDLFSATAVPYERIYRSLHNVREAFHKEGRLADSNAKLDEIAKLLAIHFALTKEGHLTAEYARLLQRETFSVDRLNRLFSEVAMEPPFKEREEDSIFGHRPSTVFEPGDEAVAFELFQASRDVIDAQRYGNGRVDALNEAFGHFVRDNFRNHTEDAQYMTPPEVVDFMVSAAFHFERNGQDPGQTGPFIVMDPSCGVGSFLTAWSRAWTAQSSQIRTSLITIGQDKVERMARLANLNFIFSGDSNSRAFVGNSLADDSPISMYDGLVDLILTNPPFGARFPTKEIRSKSLNSTPIFALSNSARSTVDSELLFLDRYLKLLRPGGLCLAIVPDGVVSAKGTSAFMRQQLARRATLLGVIELPPVTFAQAGTRTKTAVLAFQKTAGASQRLAKVFFAEASDLGFEVSKRKGVPIKRNKGRNQLPEILSTLTDGGPLKRDNAADHAFAVWRDTEPLRTDAWTPRQFAADELASGSEGRGPSKSEPLSALVEQPRRPKPRPHDDNHYFISVLHIIGEGVIDIAAVRAYRPITPGLPVEPGEIIVSRINPRIPRVLVVPNLGRPMLCSTEFEVLRPKPNVPPYALAFLLLTPFVQAQIHALTAGTSASHNRVKPEKLYKIAVPWPAIDSAFAELVERYARANETLVQVMSTIRDLRERGTANASPDAVPLAS